ncbi:sugar-binding domain-containing protein [Streptomyces sp. SID8352]|uniref:sugar-binding transcriptional regulator n=1 Tax=Streptomyces sp. SID8352 TaxID=2690338 RepID=UPI0013700253|nr:sugar-binding domain-containing protein [Streptomyces sp. SID8352]MYU26343.1 MarR family transcriptional regulator [Streptomyces sp. SID8352]
MTLLSGTGTPTALGSAAPGQVRLMAVISRLYHVHGLRQRDIAVRLDMSQARVSRVLKQAEAHGIVRTVVAVPEGLHPDLEEELEHRFGLQEVHVVEVGPARGDTAVVLGRAAARYLSEAGLSGEVVGFTSWSRALQEMARATPLASRPAARYVVEMLGDLGSPLLQHSAARSTQAMAHALGAEAVFLRTPGVMPSPAMRAAVLGDAHVRRALDLLDRLDVAFVGVGPPDVHSGLEAGDHYFTTEQLARVRAAGAVGQLNQRFLDAAGLPVRTPLDDLVVGSTLDAVVRARRRVVVAGGAAKHRAIGAALAGGYVDVLITDVATARAQLATDGAREAPAVPEPPVT